MRRIWNVIRGLVLAVLTLGALASFLLAMGFAPRFYRSIERDQGTLEVGFELKNLVFAWQSAWLNCGQCQGTHDRSCGMYSPWQPNWSGQAFGTTREFIGVGWFTGERSDYPLTMVMVRYWLFAAVLGFWPLLTLVRHRIRRRRAGTCRGCGYNLTGNVSGVCPECGQLAAAYHEPT